MASQGRSATSRQDRRPTFAGKGNSCNNVFGVSRDNDTYWDLAIIGSIGGIQRPASVIETHLTTQVSTKGCFQPGSIDRSGLHAGMCGTCVHRDELLRTAATFVYVGNVELTAVSQWGDVDRDCAIAVTLHYREMISATCCDIRIRKAMLVEIRHLTD